MVFPELPRHADGGSLRVLVADDDPGIAHLISTALRASGCEGDVVGDGPGAVRAAVADPPDVLVLDVMMPGFDGREAIRRIRVTNPEIPILVVSALGGSDVRVAMLEAGADDWLGKPFSVIELVGRIQALLRRAPLHREHRGQVA